MTVLIHPVSDKVGVVSRSISAKMAALCLAIGSGSSLLLSFCDEVCSLNAWASSSPTKDGPSSLSVSSFPHFPRRTPRRTEQRGLSLLLAAIPQTDQPCR